MIRQYAGVLALACIVVVVQTTLAPVLSGVLFIDFIFVMVVIIGMFKDPVHGAVMAFLLGGLQDIMSGQITGLCMTSRLAVFLLVQFLRVRVTPEKAVPQMAIGAGLGVVDKLLLIILYRVFSVPLALSGAQLLLMSGGIIINAALVPLFFHVFRAVPGFYEPKRGPRVRS